MIFRIFSRFLEMVHFNFNAKCGAFVLLVFATLVLLPHVTLAAPLEVPHRCSPLMNQSSCEVVVGCAWCNSSVPYEPSSGGMCYDAAANETCCAAPFSNNEEGCGGNMEICNATTTCQISTLQTHYGPCYYAACCPASAPQACGDGRCYPKSYTCCQTTACPSDKMCCDDSFQAGQCCEKGSVCCASSWELTCCPGGSVCNYDNYPPTCNTTSLQ